MAQGASAAVQEKIDRHIERACIALVLEIVRELKRTTPVATGHARANWVPSVGQPNMQEAETDAAAQAGVALVASYKLTQGKLFITNVARYIRKLNQGWSAQAPALFVETAVKRAIDTIKAKMNVDFSPTVE